jgi:hypothetical protein
MGVILPEVKPRMVVPETIADPLPDFVAALRALGAQLAAAFHAAGTGVTARLDPIGAAIAPILHTVLPVVGSEIAILAAAVGTVAAGVAAVVDAARAIVGRRARRSLRRSAGPGFHGRGSALAR